MTEPQRGTFVAECFWPGVTEAEVEALDARALFSAGEFGNAAHAVRYLGSILLREDEVLLCQFEGTPEAVREVARRAQIPFERLLESVRSPLHVPSAAALPARERNGGT